MPFIHEVAEDIGAAKESLFGDSKNRFEYDGKGQPIIAIQGVWGVWRKNGLRRVMSESNLKGVLTNMGMLQKGVDYYLNELDRDVNKYPNATLIGISTGGLIALRYAEQYGWHKFNRIITVATPFNGTPYAKLVAQFGQTYKDLTPDSVLLQEVASITPPKDKVISFFAESDRHTNIRNINLKWPVFVLDAKAHGALTNQGKYAESILVAKNVFSAE